MIHNLKTLPEYFEASRQGRKTFEIRLDDRGFKVGDWVHLHEWRAEAKAYTGRTLMSRITYITGFEQQRGFVVMALDFDVI